MYIVSLTSYIEVAQHRSCQFVLHQGSYLQIFEPHRSSTLLKDAPIPVLSPGRIGRPVAGFRACFVGHCPQGLQ